MVRVKDSKYTVWLAGYYDDFLSATAVPDNLNSPTTDWRSSKTHHGNPINGWATLNPRYTYAWCERGNGDTARFNNFSISADNQYTLNKGMGEWASLDANRNNPGKWNGLVQLQYPDSLTNANRQKFDGGNGQLGGSTKAYESTTTDDNYAAVEGYGLFCYGYDTSKRYYTAIGSNDSTFGRAQMEAPDSNFASGSLKALEANAGVPIIGGGYVPAKAVRTHMAGVYSGEVVFNTGLDDGAPKSALTPIESVCGKPFLITEVWQNSTSSYDPILSFDGSLNSKGDGDIFTIRLTTCAVDPSAAKFRLRIGCEGTAFTSTASSDTGYTRAAIDIEIVPQAYMETTTFQEVAMATTWHDYDVVMDYTNNQYDLYLNGTLIADNQTIGNKADGTPFGAADMYGWEIDAKLCAGKAAMLIDRVGLIRPLNDFPLATTDMPPIQSFSINSGTNSQSQMQLSLIDDDQQLKLMSFFNQSSYADWSMLLFRDNIDRPIWRGTLQSLSYSNDANARTPTIKVTATDYFINMDKQIPTWEMGAGAEGNSTEQIAYDRSEAQNELNTYYFGSSVLELCNKTLGYNEVEDGANVWVSHLDSRMKNRSAHPIQMYLGENDTGPNSAWSSWDAAITAGYATSAAQYRSIHSRWIKDLPKSLWFRHLFSKIAKQDVTLQNETTNAKITTTGANFSVGDNTITLSDYSSEFESPNGGSIELISSDGYVDSGVFNGVSSTTTFTSCLVRVYESRFGWVPNVLGRSEAEVIASSPVGLSNYRVQTIHILIPKTQVTAAGGPSGLTYGATLSISGMPASQPYHVLNGQDSAEWVNGDWTVAPMNLMIPCDANTPLGEITVNGVDYYVKRLQFVGEDGSNGRRPDRWFTSQTRNLGGRPLRLSGKYKFPTGVQPGLNGITVESRPATPTITYPQIVGSATQRGIPHLPLGFKVVAEYASITVKTGQTVLTLPTTNFFQRDHPSGTSFRIRKLDTRDYKHIWVLWSDMRNDGNADADIGFRKKKFGLMSPFSGNYQVNLGIADDDMSNRANFVDLKIGEDIDLWEADAEVEPISGGPWSALTNASNSESNSKYHNWEGKAGSFLIIDTSKFFNLNTVSNGGKTGQGSGGRKEIGDYLVETEGFPILIDNYWEEAPPTYENNNDYRAYAYNSKFFSNNSTTLATDVQIGDDMIQFTDATAIPDSFGVHPDVGTMIQAGQIISEKNETIFHYSSLTSSDLDARPNCTISADGAGSALITDSGSGPSNVLNVFYREGHLLKISSSASTPTIDGTYRVVGKTATGKLRISLDPGVTISSGGTCTVTAPNSRRLYSLVHLGKPVPLTQVAGEWDGTGFRGPPGTVGVYTDIGANSAYYLTVYGGVGGVVAAGTGATVAIPIDSGVSGSYDDAIVYGSLSQIFPMRLMMEINGFVENRGSGTWYHHDKYRTLYSDSLAKTWLDQTKLYGIPSLATTPPSNLMNTTRTSAVGSGRGGSITTIAAPSSGSSVVTTSAAHGLSIGDVVTLIDSYRLPTVGAGSKNYIISAVPGTTQFTIPNSTSIAGSGDYGRWRKTDSVDDFGGVNDCRNTTITTVFSSTQALGGIGFDTEVNQTFSWIMGRDSKPSFRPNYGLTISFDTANLKISELSTNNTKQITNVRVFYGSAGLYVDYPSAVLGTTPRWEIVSMPQVGTSAEAQKIARTEYAKYSEAPLSIKAEIINFSDEYTLKHDKTVMLDGARYGYVADQSRTIPRSASWPAHTSSYTTNKGYAWASLWGGNPYPGMVSALDGRDGDANHTNGATLDWDENYFWYGANSISYAVQVVHIPRNMPKTTMKTPSSGKINADGKLRFAIEVGDTSTISFTNSATNPVFTIRLLDYEWNDSSYSAHAARSTTTVVVDSNGYYEIDIPSTYWTGRVGNERITLSVDYNYLLAVAKNRCGNSTLYNHNTYVGSSTMSGTSSNSLFPLGMWKGGDADYHNLRAEWYAPRLHICDDINFVPATQIFYTDPRLELSAEVMGIKTVNWNVNNLNETVTFTLERDVSRSSTNFASLFMPNVKKGGVQTNEQDKPVADSPNYNDDKYKVREEQDNLGDYSNNRKRQSSSYTGTESKSGTGGNVDNTKSSSNRGLALGSNIIGANLLKRMKGSMDFNNDSITGGGFSVLGQKKPAKAPRNDNSVEGVDSFIVPTSGDGVMSINGMSFAGATDSTTAYNEFTTVIRVPPNAQSDQLTVNGKYSLDAVSGQVAYLETKVECVETGAVSIANLTLKDGNNSSAPIFNGSIIGASQAGNTIKVTIGRDAGTSPDTAKYSSVTLHNIKVGFDTQSVTGKSQSNQFSYSD